MKTIIIVLWLWVKASLALANDITVDLEGKGAAVKPLQRTQRW